MRRTELRRYRIIDDLRFADVRSAFVICVTLALAVLVAFILMRRFGIPSNIMNSGILIRTVANMPQVLDRGRCLRGRH